MQREESVVVLMLPLSRPVETCNRKEERQHGYYDPQTQNSVFNFRELFPWVTHRNIIREWQTFTTAGCSSVINSGYFKSSVTSLPSLVSCTNVCLLLRILGVLFFLFPTNILVVLGSTSIASHDPMVEVKLEKLLSHEKADGRDAVVGQAAFPDCPSISSWGYHFGELIMLPV